MEVEDWNAIDDGIRGPLRVLVDAGFDTFSSCEGGGYWRGHGYLRPIICFNGDDNAGLRAQALVESKGYKVFQLNRVYLPTPPAYWQLEFVGGAAHEQPSNCSENA